MLRPRALRAVLLSAVLLAALLSPPRARADTPALLLPANLGRPDVAWVFGRVLEEKHGEHGPRPWRTLRQLTGHNLPGAKVEVSFLGRTASAVSGHDGEFEVALRPAPGEAFPTGAQDAEVRVGSVRARATVLVVPADAPFLLVSDFDDTVAVTNVTDRDKMLESTFLEDAETQPAVPGMAALYRCFAAAGAPNAYVSGTPVQLAPRVARFLEKNGFPKAALHLRNLGWKNLTGGYKEPALARLATRFPGLPFVLVGDSGERDPEIFAAFQRAHPGRVLRAYVRKATASPGPAARFQGMLLFAAPVEAAADAEARGLVRRGCAIAGP
jgi:phosphatidate phosphatase APP1